MKEKVQIKQILKIILVYTKIYKTKEDLEK